jgi:hypothetical protein
MGRVVEQGLAPDKALELKMAQGFPIVINVRFAGEAHCSADAFLQKLSSLTDTDAAPRI